MTILISTTFGKLINQFQKILYQNGIHKKNKVLFSPAIYTLYLTSLAKSLIKISIILTYIDDLNKRQQKLPSRSYQFLFGNLINIQCIKKK